MSEAPTGERRLDEPQASSVLLTQALLSGDQRGAPGAAGVHRQAAGPVEHGL